jgi:translation initiation factor 2 subunit 2
MSDLTNIQVNNDDNEINDNEIDDIDLEFKKSLTLKKKKKTTKNKDNIITNIINENIDNFNYDYMLNRALNNKVSIIESKTHLKLVPPLIEKISIKKVMFVNIKIISNIIDRDIEHLKQYILTECSTSGSFDEEKRLILKGRYDSKQIESILKKYITEYVKCTNCNNLSTKLEKDPITRLTFIICNNCKSKKSVSLIKEGFHATLRSDRIKERQNN